MTENSGLEKIIEGCKRKDDECFSKLVDMYASRLYGYFYRLTANPQLSNDLLSELFLKLVKKISTFRKGNFDSWIFKIASNIFYDYLRKKQRYDKLLEAEKERLKTNIAESGRTETESFDKLQIQLNKLDTDTRELIMLRFYSQLSFKQIAKTRSLPIGTVLSKVHRGLKKLRELME